MYVQKNAYMHISICSYEVTQLRAVFITRTVGTKVCILKNQCINVSDRSVFSLIPNRSVFFWSKNLLFLVVIVINVTLKIWKMYAIFAKNNYFYYSHDENRSLQAWWVCMHVLTYVDTQLFSDLQDKLWSNIWYNISENDELGSNKWYRCATTKQYPGHK